MIARCLQGMIEPEVPEGTAASVFAIFDESKKLQFVGFSKDLRNSLRTVFSRRPDKAFFYKWDRLSMNPSVLLELLPTLTGFDCLNKLPV